VPVFTSKQPIDRHVTHVVYCNTCAQSTQKINFARLSRSQNRKTLAEVSARVSLGLQVISAYLIDELADSSGSRVVELGQVFSVHTCVQTNRIL
jgi:hypothetical protein